MGKMTRGKKMVSQKGMSSTKKKNIFKNKQGKKGLLKETSSKERRKTKREEQRKDYFAQLANKSKDSKVQHEIQEENQITGEDMMEMIDPEDMEALIGEGKKKMKKDAEKKKKIDAIESKYGHAIIKQTEADETLKPNMKLKQLLPIATEAGWEERVIQVEQHSKELDQNSKYKREVKSSKKRPLDDSGLEDSSSDEDDTVPEGEIKSVSEILAQRARRINKKKVRIGCIANNIVQDSAKVGNLEALMMMHTEINALTDPTLMIYCLVSIRKVFNSILPGYKIHESALKQTLKKDTYLVAKTEDAMLKCYRQFLQVLEDHIEKYRQEPQNLALKAVGKIAVQCFGELFISHPKFNYSVNIVQTLIPVLNFADEEFRKIAFASITQTIRMDKKCSVALDIVRKVYKLIQKKKYRVKKEVLKVFLSLRVKEFQNSDTQHENQKRMSKDLTHSERMLKKLKEQNLVKKSKKQRKDTKKMAKLREKMSDLRTKELMDEKNENHSEILKIVFGVYIHIMKRKPNSKLMSSVLEGLALFAHLINMEFFSDLLSLMGDFLENGILATRESLHCIQTVFTILSGQGQYLTVDPTRFYKYFYVMMVDMKTSDLHKNMPIMLKIFQQMLISRKKKVTPQKVLSFAKRLSTLCLNLQHDASIPTLVCLKELFTTFPCTEDLLDPDPEGCPGVFQPHISDPEHTNAGSTALWELHLLTRHYHPYVRSLASNIISGIPLREVNQLNFFNRREIVDLFEDFRISKLELKPSLPSPGAHLKVKKRNKNVDLVYDVTHKRWTTTN